MFYPGKPVIEVGSADFPNVRSALGSPLAKSIYSIDGVVRVFFGSDFVNVTKSDDVSWDILKPEIFAAVMDFYSSGQPLFLDSQAAAAAAAKDTPINEDNSETVAMIKELLETRIRPAVQDDGGDIEYCGFDPESGIVKLRLQGACSGCPSSSVTLKSGIENMLIHYVPELSLYVFLDFELTALIQEEKFLSLVSGFDSDCDVDPDPSFREIMKDVEIFGNTVLSVLTLVLHTSRTAFGCYILTPVLCFK
ncbi:hypothetical protein Bca101_070729 [Brassica carinata]